MDYRTVIRRAATFQDKASIICILRGNIADAGVVEDALRALHALAIESRTQKIELRDPKFLNDILDSICLHLDKCATQEIGFKLLSRLIQNDETKAWWKMKTENAQEFRSSLLFYRNLANLGFLKLVIDVMEKHMQNPTISEIGCLILRLLARSEENEGKIARLNGLPVILDAMRVHQMNTEIQEQGCRALSNLAVNEGNKTSIADLGGIEQVLASMRRWPTVPGIQAWGCGALANLAANDELEKRIGSLGGIEVVIHALRGNLACRSVQEESSGALCNLTVDPENQRRFMANNGLDAIHSTMTQLQEFAEVQENCCTCLRNLVEVRTRLNEFLERGFMDVIIRAMKLHANHARVQEKICMLLANLCELECCRTELVALGGFDLIAVALAQHYEQAGVVKFACHALRRLLREADASGALQRSAVVLGVAESAVLAAAFHPKSRSSQEQAWCLLHFLSGAAWPDPELEGVGLSELRAWPGAAASAVLNRSTWRWLRLREQGGGARRPRVPPPRLLPPRSQVGRPTNAAAPPAHVQRALWRENRFLARPCCPSWKVLNRALRSFPASQCLARVCQELSDWADTRGDETRAAKRPCTKNQRPVRVCGVGVVA
mmetsp:Transcript_14660/g.39954  ORF Transcript_14660/g.39954 Transcript_14660/m.39954 type:complete len:609 (+) Transcript_14660:17-1843(+)